MHNSNDLPKCLLYCSLCGKEDNLDFIASNMFLCRHIYNDCRFMSKWMHVIWSLFFSGWPHAYAYGKRFEKITCNYFDQDHHDKWSVRKPLCDIIQKNKEMKWQKIKEIKSWVEGQCSYPSLGPCCPSHDKKWRWSTVTVIQCQILLLRFLATATIPHRKLWPIDGIPGENCSSVL